MIELWKKALFFFFFFFSLDEGHKIGAIFMDLSKAVYTLNHNLLLAKLKMPMVSQIPLYFLCKIIYKIDSRERT